MRNQKEHILRTFNLDSDNLCSVSNQGDDFLHLKMTGFFIKFQDITTFNPELKD